MLWDEAKVRRLAGNFLFALPLQWAQEGSQHREW